MKQFNNISITIAISIIENIYMIVLAYVCKPTSDVVCSIIVQDQ